MSTPSNPPPEAPVHSNGIETEEKVQNPSQDFAKDKTRSILSASETRDLSSLQDLAISQGGFLSDANRCHAWPILLGHPFPPTPPVVDEKEGMVADFGQHWRHLPRHRDEDQVKLDVDRSFVYYPNDNSESELDTKKSELSDLITEVLRRQPWLCYFQGYHDICQVFLLVLPPNTRSTAVARLSGLRIRDFMLPDLNPAINHLRLIPDILNAVDRQLCQHLSKIEPYFALADTLTMFAHNVQKFGDIARLFDALLAREQVFSIYIFAQIVLRRRDELFEHDEADMLHFALSKLPQDLDLDSVVRDAAQMLEKHPPESLRAWRYISNASVLRTTRDQHKFVNQSLEDGHAYFKKQLRELKLVKALEAIRSYNTRQNRVALATILVGIAAALYMRKGAGVGTSGMSALVHWFRSSISSFRGHQGE